VRRTVCATTLAGQSIPEGALVIPRNPNPHVAFGFGIHNCLGAHLARLEGEIAISSMVKHLSSIRLAERDVSTAGQLGGPSHLKVRIEKA